MIQNRLMRKAAHIQHKDRKWEIKTSTV